MVSIRAPVIAITLLTVCLLATHTSAECCRKYMKSKIPFPVIRGYSVQDHREMCPINAIIFHTKRGRKACTDPALNWVMDYVNRLGKEAQIVHMRTAKAP
ncbi:C-C motif chemokine 20a.3 [Lates calcarifer]|uniref:C-C motif chemokine n=1 Tax=Lates calcarifer TaxID=8187 RepID=A0A4W6E9F0_LATCA|nr:C-C motif chemokine 20a.3 [Lates calcarifer]